MSEAEKMYKFCRCVVQQGLMVWKSTTLHNKLEKSLWKGPWQESTALWRVSSGNGENISPPRLPSCTGSSSTTFGQSVASKCVSAHWRIITGHLHSLQALVVPFDWGAIRVSFFSLSNIEQLRFKPIKTLNKAVKEQLLLSDAEKSFSADPDSDKPG